MINDDRMHQILKHAARVFHEKGYDRATIRDVAKAAEMSLAGLYYYIKSKEELLFLIQERIFGDLLARADEQASATGEPEEKVRRFILNHLSYFIENLDEMKVLSHEFERLEGDRHARIAGLRRRYYDVAEKLTAAVLSQRLSTSLDPRTAALSLFGMMNWIYTWFRPETDGSPEEVADKMASLFLCGLRKG